MALPNNKIKKLKKAIKKRKEDSKPNYFKKLKKRTV